MIFKQFSLYTFTGEITPFKLYESLKKDYPNIIHFNPVDSAYDGSGFRQATKTLFDGVKIKNFVKGKVVRGIKNLKSDIKYSCNIEIYRRRLVFYERTFETDFFYDEFKSDFTSPLEIEINDDKKSIINPSAKLFELIIEDVMHLKDIGIQQEKFNIWDKDRLQLIKKYALDKFNYHVSFIGNNFNALTQQLTIKPFICLDEDKKLDILEENEKKISNDYEIYELKDYSCIYTTNIDSYNKLIETTKLDFICDFSFACTADIITAWLNQIRKKSDEMFDQIYNKNEMYWKQMRTTIEIWQLLFLKEHSTIYKDYKQLNEVMLSIDDFFNSKDYYLTKTKDSKDVALKLLDEAKYAFDNISTPGHTHDEQLLQKETEKGNERILLLSFLAMSIPMIGAILSPALSLTMKLIAGSIILSLPLLYIIISKFSKNRVENSNMKRYLLEHRDEMNKNLDMVKDMEDKIKDSENLPEQMKNYIIDIFELRKKTAVKTLKTIDKKIKKL